jgi:hypothetical protein
MKSKISLLALLSLSACGGSGGNSGTASVDSWSSYSVATAADLPSCMGDIVGRLYYVEADNTFQTCKSTGWTTIGLGSSISAITTCSTIVGGGSFRTYTVNYSNGELLVHCSIADSGAEYGNTHVYMANQNGTSSEGCLLNYDADSPSYGFWNFSKSGTVRTAVYNDSSSNLDGGVVTFAAGDCTTY